MKVRIPVRVYEKVVAPDGFTLATAAKKLRESSSEAAVKVVNGDVYVVGVI